MKSFFLVFALLLVSAKHAKRSPHELSTGVFDLEKLPVGKNVTFPRPATTVVPTLARVHLTGTDMPQSLSLKAVAPLSGTSLETSRAGQRGSLRIAIYDRNADRVFYKQIEKDTVYIYHLRDLRPILLITEGGDARLKLQVESNKPLEIGR